MSVTKKIQSKSEPNSQCCERMLITHKLMRCEISHVSIKIDDVIKMDYRREKYIKVIAWVNFMHRARGENVKAGKERIERR